MANHAVPTLRVQRTQAFARQVARVIDERRVLYRENNGSTLHALHTRHHMRRKNLLVRDPGIVEEPICSFECSAVFQRLWQRSFGSLAELTRHLHQARRAPRITELGCAKLRLRPIFFVAPRLRQQSVSVIKADPTLTSCKQSYKTLT